MPKMKPGAKDAQMHNELKGFEINIDAFGQIKANRRIDLLNEFLDDKVKDKKLTDTQIEKKAK